MEKRKIGSLEASVAGLGCINFGSGRQVRDNASAVDWQMTAEDLSEIEQVLSA
jgi:aryl-alcohol dehydrogenase-like predicted oxidoreductase